MGGERAVASTGRVHHRIERAHCGAGRGWTVGRPSEHHHPLKRSDVLTDERGRIVGTEEASDRQEPPRS